MAFDKEKIQIKHILEMSKEMEGYPTQDDIIYFVCKRAADKMKNEVTFSDYMIGQKMPSVSDEILQSNLTKLVEDGIIEITKQTDSKTSYKVLLNPYDKTKE
jgi:hypothetical protein